MIVAKDPETHPVRQRFRRRRRVTSVWGCVYISCVNRRTFPVCNVLILRDISLQATGCTQDSALEQPRVSAEILCMWFISRSKNNVGLLRTPCIGLTTPQRKCGGVRPGSRLTCILAVFVLSIFGSTGSSWSCGAAAHEQNSQRGNRSELAVNSATSSNNQSGATTWNQPARGMRTNGLS